MSKPFHLEFTPALYNDLSQISVWKKQNVSSISILFLLAQVLLADEPLAEHK